MPEEKRKENRIDSELLPDDIKQVLVENLDNKKSFKANIKNISSMGIGLELQMSEEEKIDLPKKGDELELLFNEINFRCLGLCMFTRKMEDKIVVGVFISNPAYQNKFRQKLEEKKII